MPIKYVTGSDRHGWLDVRIEGIAEITSLPYGLKVETLGIEAGREKFRVLEGIRKGKNGSVRLTAAGGSQFGSVTQRGAASISFNLSREKITFNGRTIDAITDPSNPVSPGTWKLQIPDEKHTAYGNGYLSRSQYATTWFRLIGDGRDRYLHPGRVSAGCTTVTDVENWGLLWQHLILARLGDGMNVGTLSVTR
jgi:hypothetical protein